MFFSASETHFSIQRSLITASPRIDFNFFLLVMLCVFLKMWLDKMC